MIPISNLLDEKDDGKLFNKLTIIRRKKSSYPPKEDDFADETIEKETPDEKISKKKTIVKDKKSGENIEIDEPPVIIRRKVKK